MRIKVVTPRENGKVFRLRLPVPLFLAGWSFIWKHLPPQSRQYAAIAPQLVRAMRQYKRTYGSWNLVEVETADKSTNVVIRV